MSTVTCWIGVGQCSGSAAGIVRGGARICRCDSRSSRVGVAYMAEEDKAREQQVDVWLVKHLI